MIFGFFVFLKKWNSRVHQVFLLFAISVAVWGFGGYKIGTIINQSSSIFWWRFTHVGITFIPVFFLHFTYLFLGNKKKKVILLSYLIGIAFFILNFTNLFIKDLRLAFSSFYYISNPTILYSFFVFLWLSAIGYAHYELFKKFKESSGLKRAQIKYFFLAMAIGFSGGSTCFLPVFNVNLYPIFNFTVPLYPPIMAYAILKYRLMDIRVVVRQGAVYAFSFLNVLAVSLASHFLINLFYAPPLLLEILLISALAAGLFHPLTEFYLKIANRYFFYSLYSYQETIKKLSNKLVTILDLEKLTKTIAEEIIGTMKLGKAGVLLRDEESGKYRIQHIVGFKEDNGISLVKDNFLTQRLEQTQKPVVYEELGLEIRDAKNEKTKQKLGQLRANMKKIEAELCLPLISRNRLKGMVVLGRKMSNEAYNAQDLELLETLAVQGSLAIENAQLYDQVQDLTKHLQEKVDQQVGKITDLLKTREELLTIKEDFLHIISHQLRTPVSIFHGALDDWKTGYIKKVSKKEREQMEKAVIVSAERLKNTVNDMLNALDIDRGMEFDFEEVDIVAVINEIIAELKPNYDKKNLYLKLETTKNLPKIQASLQFIKEALFNLADNAEKYAKTGGTTIIVSRLNENSVNIAVKDAGIGLTEENKEKLFQTQFYRGDQAQDMSPDGSGLGLYIVKRIIDRHHGQIVAQSEGTDKGSVFTITLPVKQSKT